jgi:hypothetical protein
MDCAVFGITGALAIVVLIFLGTPLLGALARLVLGAVEFGVGCYYAFIQQPEIQQTGDYCLEQGRDASTENRGEGAPSYSALGTRHSVLSPVLCYAARGETGQGRA